MKKNEPPIIIEQTYNTSVESVWDAITKDDQMQQWFFENIPSFKAQVGFKTQFKVQTEDRSFLHLWEVIEVEPLKKIAYNWKYDGYSGDSFVEIELFDEPNGTRLKLSHHILEDFQDDIPEFKRESGIAGRTYFIKERLKDFLAGNK